MRFFTKRPVPPAVPIIPMIDILTILLIFFIANTQWKKPSSLLKIEVPSVQFISGETEKKVMATLSVGRNNQMVFDEKPVEFSGLTDRLREFREKHPEVAIKMEADKNISLETLIKVWDSLTAAGIEIKTVPAQIDVQAGQEN